MCVCVCVCVGVCVCTACGGVCIACGGVCVCVCVCVCVLRAVRWCVCVCKGWTGTVTQEAGGGGEVEGRKRRVARQAVPHEEVAQCHAYR